MSTSYDLVIRGGTLVTHDGIGPGDVGVRDGRIVEVGQLRGADGGEVIDATGLHVLPGIIDTQVHFREPGNEHKEDLESGTRAAVMGGVTAVFEMPNTNPLTTTEDALNDKLARADGRAWSDYAFYVGATTDNAESLRELEILPGCCGIKIFMGSSTGSLLVPDDDSLRRVLESCRRRVAVHAEDEERLKVRSHIAAEGAHPRAHPDWRDVETAFNATRRLISLAEELRRRVHVLHVTTADEAAYLAEHKDVASVEVTPQHLTLEAPDCYERLGAFAQMNPPIREGHHREGLWNAIAQGVVDVIGSDHAPHTREEKDQVYPNTPSGMPGVQTLLPLMLNHVSEGRLSLLRLIDLLCEGPNRLFGIVGKGRLVVGYDADVTLVDLAASREITDDWVAAKCGWTPFAGMTVTGWPVGTIIRGRSVMRDGQLMNEPSGQVMRFYEGAGP
ncbi:MAG: dihydroorotase [Alphaproteobacteria bacterium]|nr:dihydroorotase [Alphaproteobacteria bacterium]|tara:strand:+ start:1634 stop:2971 length:1338 start_codon:yes stop_codon:yes gene_type:complete